MATLVIFGIFCVFTFNEYLFSLACDSVEGTAEELISILSLWDSSFADVNVSDLCDDVSLFETGLRFTLLGTFLLVVGNVQFMALASYDLALEEFAEKHHVSDSKPAETPAKEEKPAGEGAAIVKADAEAADI